jgi:hypothetical protein
MIVKRRYLLIDEGQYIVVIALFDPPVEGVMVGDNHPFDACLPRCPRDMRDAAAAIGML